MSSNPHIRRLPGRSVDNIYPYVWFNVAPAWPESITNANEVISMVHYRIDYTLCPPLLIAKPTSPAHEIRLDGHAILGVMSDRWTTYTPCESRVPLRDIVGNIPRRPSVDHRGRLLGYLPRTSFFIVSVRPYDNDRISWDVASPPEPLHRVVQRVVAANTFSYDIP